MILKCESGQMSKSHMQNTSITNAKEFVNYILRKKKLTLPDIPDFCVITHSDTILEIAKKNFDYEMVDIGSRKSTEIYFFLPDKEKPFAIVTQQPGSPMSAVILEELIAVGFNNFITTGTIGHPTLLETPVLQVGDIVLVSGSLIYEGTSKHYASTGGTSYPDEEMISSIRTFLKQDGIEFHEGLIATTDAIYRETEEFICELISRGAIGIDMEVSAQISVCNFYDKKIAAILYVSDVISSNQNWNLGQLEDVLAATEEKVFNILMRLVHRNEILE